LGDEQSQNPRRRLREAAGQFNPVAFDPVECVALAKAAGMKYIISS
jgi:alpha-L-fucosidase